MLNKSTPALANGNDISDSGHGFKGVGRVLQACPLVTYPIDNKMQMVLPLSPPLHCMQDVSDGHTVAGFSDGSGRSQNPDGRELKARERGGKLPKAGVDSSRAHFLTKLGSYTRE